MGEPEFVDPGPNQVEAPYPDRIQPGRPRPAGPGFGVRRPGPAPESPGYGRREVVGFLLMLLAAAVLPLIASTQTVFVVHEQSIVSGVDFSVDAWGEYGAYAGSGPVPHGSRFALLLLASATGYGVLLLSGALVLLGRRTARPRRFAGVLAGGATGVLGLLLGTTLAMMLDIESTFDSFRTAAGRSPAPVVEIRLRVGGAVWLAAAGVLAGLLAVLAALRVQRLWPEQDSQSLQPPPVVEDTPGSR